MVTPTEIYELWLSEDGSYDFLPSTNNSARNLLDQDAKLITKIEADSWESARQKQYALLGWGNYLPAPDPVDFDQVFITDPQGRETTFDIHGLFGREEVFQLTKITWNKLNLLRKENIVVPESSQKSKFYSFSQLLQLQAYVLIHHDKSAVIRTHLLKKVLRFYSDNYRDVRRHESFPYSIGSVVKSIEPDLSNRDDLFEEIRRRLDFKGQDRYMVHIYPSLLNVISALHENVQSVYGVEFNDFRQMLVA
ncbi:MAG: hypothetical protein VKJ46_11975 [Leptolyngbyaceae bacterium]|nr:hypothetical protein [Leptolyngbyaceae bacterium]